MLKIQVTTPELYNEETEEFIFSLTFELELEHSLLSVSKWESEFQKPFLSDEEKSDEETFGYIRHMISTPDFPPEGLEVLKTDQETLVKIRDYIQASLTGTTIREDKSSPPSRERITSELIYYWMTEYNIPWEAQHWHLSRLLMLIRVCSAKRQEANRQANAGKKTPPKMSGDQMAARKAENARRRAQLGTSG